MRQYGLDRTANMAAYLPQAQNTDFNYSLVARTKVAAERLQNAVRDAFLKADKAQPVFNVVPFQTYLKASIAERSFTLALLAFFAALAVVLAAVGIYGVVSHSVSAQTREFGIRAALGATRAEILMLLGRNGIPLLGCSLCAGIVAAVGLTRFASALLFGVKPWDISICFLVLLILTCVAVLAAFVPARRAAMIDPAVALRDE